MDDVKCCAVWCCVTKGQVLCRVVLRVVLCQVLCEGMYERRLRGRCDGMMM